MNPRVEPSDIPRLYPPDYAPHSASPPVEQAPRSVLRRMKAKVGAWTENVRLNPSIKLDAHSRVLDIGCGAGEFLDRLRRRTGAQVFGVDFSDNARISAEKNFSIPVYVGTIEDLPQEKESFDLITAWWLFEHVSEPRGFLDSVRGLLRPGGTFAFSVPNLASLNAWLFKSRWYHLDCPRHLFLWTPRSVKQILHQAGFRVQSIRYDKSPWGLLGSLQYWFYENNLNPQTANRIRGNYRYWKPLLTLTIPLGLLRMSDTIVVHATIP
jgi:cyclopropane fatty-acyl-phospholipid synthase-like methyltransferase